MTDKQKRVLEIGNDLMSWSLSFLKSLNRIIEVEQMSDISDFDKRRIKTAAARVQKLFEEVIATHDSLPTADDALDHFFASYDRLCEETTKLNQCLDKLLARRL
jgi:hypothetical protein